MPRISYFYGITIAMFFDESTHRGNPHFHAKYGEFTASIAIDDCSILAGDLPVRAQKIIREWVGLHRDELVENWEKARSMQELSPIAPLP